MSFIWLCPLIIFCSRRRPSITKIVENVHHLFTSLTKHTHTKEPKHEEKKDITQEWTMVNDLPVEPIIPKPPIEKKLKKWVQSSDLNETILSRPPRTVPREHTTTIPPKQPDPPSMPTPEKETPKLNKGEKSKTLPRPHKETPAKIPIYLQHLMPRQQKLAGVKHGLFNPELPTFR